MNGDMHRHEPVLAKELVDAIVVRGGGSYVDCTFGRGGHAQAVLERAGPAARLLALDRDPDAVEAGLRLSRNEPRLTVAHARFSALAAVMEDRKVEPDGIYFDLGVSSPQLDQPERGFSFLRDGPLDMRMDPGCGEPAREWLARASEREIERVLADLGEERHARRIARAIVRAREEVPIQTTSQLEQLIWHALPEAARRCEPGQHPATRSFQALRMQVNQELEELRAGLSQALDGLRVGGRLAVISFHSGEDRIVKRFFRDASNPPRPSRHVPLPPDRPEPRLTAVSKAIRAGDREVARNPRARSARLRYAEKCG